MEILKKQWPGCIERFLSWFKKPNSKQSLLFMVLMIYFSQACFPADIYRWSDSSLWQLIHILIAMPIKFTVQWSIKVVKLYWKLEEAIEITRFHAEGLFGVVWLELFTQFSSRSIEIHSGETSVGWNIFTDLLFSWIPFGIPLKECCTNFRVYGCSDRGWLEISSVLVKNTKNQTSSVSLVV